MRGKNLIKKRVGYSKIKVKVRCLIVMPALVLAMSIPRIGTVQATGCPDLRLVFARGSGGEQWMSADYLEFKATIEEKLATTSLNYEFIDLDYPAVGVGLDNLDVSVGALVGGGDAYEFGASVKSGVKNLDKMINGGSCPGTKYVIGGYSQGAMVVSRALSNLRADRMIYAATFGDPKIYLPEGRGAIPAACKGENLSDYRIYVPDCQAYTGLLGAYVPYEPDAMVGKVGVWCNKRDIFCSSHWNISDHLKYIADDLYEDASRVIFDKICAAFGIKNTVGSPHDTVILIDSTGSMSGLIDKYKDEAARLAEKTWAAGGRVALYDYRDYQEGYGPKQHCSFETCNQETFTAGLNAIHVSQGGDAPESLLASSLHVMQELNWKQGSTKSIVVLTDAGYHDPDYDIGKTTQLDVVRMSKKIDPVNFYVITEPENVDSYRNLTNETDGKVVTTVDDLSELTDYIIARYDSLPRVEESDDMMTLPEITVDAVEDNGNNVTVRFRTTGSRVLVILNDTILGAADGALVTITELNRTTENRIMLVPLGDNVRGEGAEIILDELGSAALPMPKTPNTGRV